MAAPTSVFLLVFIAALQAFSAEACRRRHCSWYWHWGCGGCCTHWGCDSCGYGEYLSGGSGGSCYSLPSGNRYQPNYDFTGGYSSTPTRTSCSIGVGSAGSYISASGTTSSNRVCKSCEAGKYTSTTTQRSCTVEDGCTNSGKGNENCKRFDTKATCDDTPGADIKAYTCTCTTTEGYHFSDGSCIDVNGCDGVDCTSSGDGDAKCIDEKSPKVGFTCNCTAGYEFVGKTCMAIDSCNTNSAQHSTCASHGDTSARCSNLKPPKTGNTCDCTQGYKKNKTGSNTQTCVDINGCEGEMNTCPNGGVKTDAGFAYGDTKAECQDKVAPETGHRCVCTTGYEDTGGTCTDIDGCAGELDTCKASGDSLAKCQDKAANATGHTCACSPGRADRNGVCIDIDGCADQKCDKAGDTGSECVDAPAPHTGFYCNCTRGYVQVGAICKPIDSCANNPCNMGSDGDITSECNNLVPPKIGQTCGCSAGYSEDCGKGNETTTKEKGADGAATMRLRELRHDHHHHRVLQPSSSYRFQALGAADNKNGTDADSTCTCIDTDSCLAHKCSANGNEAAECVDEKPPQESYTCMCTVGYTYSNGTCLDINGCASKPCVEAGDTSATCKDAPAPALGTEHNCTCSSGYHSTKGSCTNIDGCKGNKCASKGDGNATCADVPPPGVGFNCECTDGYEEHGGICIDTPGCAEKPCKSQNDQDATCTDNKAPQVGNNCTCSEGYLLQSIEPDNFGHRCINFNACPGNTCKAGGDKGAVCNDLQPPSMEYACTCSPDYHFDFSTRNVYSAINARGSCKRNLCLVPSVFGGTYGTGECDGTAGGCPLLRNNDDLDTGSIICREGYKRSKIKDFKCDCKKHRETCAELTMACVSVRISGEMPDGENCATFNNAVDKCCAHEPAEGKKCAYDKYAYCKPQQELEAAEDKCRTPSLTSVATVATGVSAMPEDA